MTYNEVLSISKEYLIPQIKELYNLDEYACNPIESHHGGRNLIFTCEHIEKSPKILRVSYLNDRKYEDYVAELEFVRFLYENGASVSNVISSKNQYLVEKLMYKNQPIFITLFEKAAGKMLAENNYKYIEGAPLSQYFFDCGKTLGKIHQISKKYQAIHCRYDFFDKFNISYIEKLLPQKYSVLTESIANYFEKLNTIDRTVDTYGTVHFDYSDGNYHIDFDSGKLTVYDFDNCCNCWYMYDLAELWTHGTGWVMFERDVDKRKVFMNEYFNEIIRGYRTQTNLEQSTLKLLPLFIQITLIENIVDKFEERRRNNIEEDDDEIAYLVKCLVDNIDYKGFFDKIYSCDSPFEYEA